MNDNRPISSVFKTSLWQTRLLWGSLIVCLLPFVVLSFFSVFTTDDYTLAVNYRDHGFWATQRIVYSEWTGRVTSTFLGTFFMKFGLSDRTYFAPALILLLGTWLSLYFLLSMANRCCLRRFYRRERALAATFLLMLSLFVQSDTGTGFYWFSSAITYQPAFIFFLLLIGCLIRRFADPASAKQWLLNGTIVLLILIITGCNEVAAVFQAFFLAWLLATTTFIRGKLSLKLLGCLVTSIAAGLFLMFSSGILSGRYTDMRHSSHGIIGLVPIILFRLAAVFYYVLKIPLFWMLGGLAFLVGRRLRNSSLTSIIPTKWTNKKFLLPALAGIPLVLLLTLSAVLFATGGSLPDRALNNLTDWTALWLLALLFLAGIHNSPGAGTNLISTPLSFFVWLPNRVFAVLLVAGLLANEPFVEAAKNVLSGYFFHGVQQDRRMQMAKAAKSGQKTVELKPYSEALKDKIKTAFPTGTSATLNKWIRASPSFLSHEADPDTPDPGWPAYYHLETVRISHTPVNQ